MAVAGRDDDLRILEILDLREGAGLPVKEVAHRLGVTKGAVCGVINRINRAADAVPCRCRRKVNRDGGMPRRWWAQ